VNQVGIHLDRDDAFGPLKKLLRQRAFAWTNFDDEASSIATRGGSDSLKDGFAGKEVLPQTPAQRL
jgi:hypothetical protein